MSGRHALGVLGDPLVYTRSPELHRAGLAALGLVGDSRSYRTPLAELGDRLRTLASEGLTGVNLTHPLKQAALEHLDRVSEASRAARSVNTVGFSPEGSWGDTTDGDGFVDWLTSLGRDPARERVTLLGGGGAARSVALALRAAGCPHVLVLVRDPERARPAWAAIEGARLERWGGDAAAPRDDATATDPGVWPDDGASVIVNATPLAGASGPCVPRRLPPAALVLDLVYGPEITPWVLAARARGIEAYDGLGLLVFQARRSLWLWTGRPVPVEPLAAAVGWPR